MIARRFKLVSLLRLVLCTSLANVSVVFGASACFARTPNNSIIDGIPVIDRLNARDFALGTHRLWFRAGETAAGQPWFVPVLVLKGAFPGPRLLLTAAVHGDELNGIAVVHRLAAKLDLAHLHGVVIAVPGLNTPGVLLHSRNFALDAGPGANLNRLMPGKADGDVADRFAFALWNRLLHPNADALVDLHTQSRGTAYVMFAFAGSPRALEMAKWIGPDIIKLDPGVKGSLETEMLRVGVPAITLELGRPEVFDEEIIARAVAGIERLMVGLGMSAQGTAPPASPEPFVGNAIKEVLADRGGFARIFVPLGGTVKEGDLIATISDAFGRIIQTIRSPVSGRVNTLATNPLRQPGDMLVRIVFVSSDQKCQSGC